MKRAYQKPGIYIENLTVSQCIAADCSPRAELPGEPMFQKDACAWKMENEIVWTGQMQCSFEIGIDTPFNGICYNNPNGALSLFSS